MNCDQLQQLFNNLMDLNQKFDPNIPNFYTNSGNWVYFNQMPYVGNPYCEFFRFYQFQQGDRVKQQEKVLVDAAVQTENISEQQEKHSEIQSLKLEDEQGSLKQFPLPNKEKLFELFQCPSSRRREISVILSEICTEKTKPLNNFYRSVGEKIINFKKTKEEIIKFLIRRAWRKQDKDLDLAREKYYSKFKSMNAEYLSMVFSDTSFVVAYQEMMQKFDEEFDSFNQERFDRFYDYLLNCYIKNNLLVFKNSKECKSKLPYPLIWKAHIHEIAQGLYETYYMKKSQKKKNSREQAMSGSEKEESD